MRIARTRSLLYSLLAIMLLLASVPAFADVVSLPSWWNQANARRHFTFNGTTPVEDTDTPWGHGFAATMSYSLDTHVYRLDVQNDPDPGGVKDVWLQYTWLETGPGAFGDPTNANGHGSSTGAWSPHDWVVPEEDLGGGLHRRTVHWTIYPQPANEWFEFWTAGEWRVTETAVLTICTHVPEPSSLATLLASGLFTGVFAMRRRRH
jgi:hypothetical protein